MIVLKAGTKMISIKPITSISVPCLLSGSLSPAMDATSPLNAGKKDAMKVGINALTTEGRLNNIINLPEVTFPAIHNIVVVTSPIGVQAPPAFALITIQPAYHILSVLSETNFRKIEIKTIVAVRLSIIADNIKALAGKLIPIIFKLPPFKLVIET